MPRNLERLRVFNQAQPNATNPNRGQMICRLSIAALIAALLVATPIASAHTSAAASEVKAVYKSVMLAEYFGPQSAVCGNLTSEGVKEFKLETATSSCAKAFKANQHVLKHKQPGNDNSGYSKSEWRTAVKQFVSALKVRIHGSKASVTGPSNLGDATLVKVAGHWLFASEPPSVGP